MTDLLLAVHHGLVVFCVGMTTLALLVTWLATPDRVAYCDDADAARRHVGLSMDAISALTQTARSKLSPQFNRQAPVSVLGRIPDLPTQFEVAFIKLRARRHGLVVIDGVELQQLIAEVRALPKRMVKAELVVNAEKESA